MKAFAPLYRPIRPSVNTVKCRPSNDCNESSSIITIGTLTGSVRTPNLQIWSLLKLYKLFEWTMPQRDCHKASIYASFSPEKTRRNCFRRGIRILEHPQSIPSIIRLQEHLGHASFNTTARYRKIANEERRRLYNRLWISGNSDQSGKPAS